MLQFDERPAFLNRFALVGFESRQSLGKVGELRLLLHPRDERAVRPLDALGELWDRIGNTVRCASGDWRFSGGISHVEYNASRPSFHVIYRDALADLEGQHASRVFCGRSTEDVLRTLLDGGSLRVASAAARTPRTLAIQYQESALDFAHALARECGAQLWCDGEAVVLSDTPTDLGVVLSLDVDVLDYRFTLGASGPAVRAMFIDAADEHAVQVETVGAGARGARGAASHTMHAVHDRANREVALNRARTAHGERAADAFTLRGSSSRAVSPGGLVTIAASRSSGGNDERVVFTDLLGYHKAGMAAPQWSFIARRPEALLSAGGPVPPPRLRCTVVRIEDADDPEYTGRCRVSFPWDESHAVSPWLRSLSPYRGDRHWLHVPPRRGDQALALWGQWDMDPMLLGPLAAGTRAETNGALFSFRTSEGHSIVVDRDGIQFRYDDGGGPTEIACTPQGIRLETAHGHAVRVDRDHLAMRHAGGGCVDLGERLLKIVSPGDIEIRNAQGASIKLSGPRVAINDGALEVM